MRLRFIASGLLFPLFIMACQGEGTPSKGTTQAAQEANEAAEDAIGVLQRLMTARDFSDMGFDSLEEVAQARLGEPLDVNYIGLEELRAYKSGTDPIALLKPTLEMVYPVIVNEAVKSSIIIVRRNSGYVLSVLGNADVIKRLSLYRKTAGEGSFIVQVPALNLYFLGQDAENSLFLTPIVDDPRVQMKVGERMPADRILRQLVPLARDYNGLPN